MKEINELKARAYDYISNIEYFQKLLQEINSEIVKKVTEYNEANKNFVNNEE
jgi:hypothetical protein